MAMLDTKIAVDTQIDVSASSDVFQKGSYQLSDDITVKTSDPTKPPAELFIVSPSTKGTFPVLLFCHGFMCSNTWYTDLLRHIASHGYIVVAPKFYGLIPISVTDEVKKAAQVTQWLTTSLANANVLPGRVAPDLDNLVLSGHSRGGKTAFALALGKVEQKPRKNKPHYYYYSSLPTNAATTAPLPKFKAVIGIDPVAGPSISNRLAPKILEYIPRCFDQSIPVAVIGTGYGNQPLGWILPFAADGVNGSEFFNESKPPACYFLAKDYGHCDILDDTPAYWASYVCKCGKGPKDLMRKSVGGIVVAFLRAYLGGGDDQDLNDIVADPGLAPITLDPVIYVKE